MTAFYFNMMIHLFFCAIVLTSVEFSVSTASTTRSKLESAVGDNRRPVWNIAHMVNAVYQLDYYLNEGANSVEFDIAFNSDGVATFTFHGVPCDCFRTCTRYEKIVPYLEYLSHLTSPSDSKYRKELILLYMDMKLSGLSSQAITQAGSDIASKMIEYYWKRGKSGAVAYVVLCIPSINYSSFIEGYNKTLTKEGFSQYLEKTGYDFSDNENLDSIKNVYQRLNIDKHIWQGDGITNCMPRGTTRLKECISRRDIKDYNYIYKVYWWTVDKLSTMRFVFRLGVDGIITNYPDRLVQMLNEAEFSGKFRMATIDDNPFIKHLATSYMTARGGNISHTQLQPYDGEEDEILDNCEPPDEKHWQMEVDPFPGQDVPSL